MWGQGTIWQVDGEDAQGDWQWDQREEEKPNKHEEVNIIDQDGYQIVNKSRRLGQQMPEEQGHGTEVED